MLIVEYSFYSLFIQSRQYIFKLCFKVYKLFVFLINSGKLFHREDQQMKIFLPHVSLAKKDFNFFQIVRTSVIDKFECNEVYAVFITLLLVDNQFISLKYSSDMWCVLSSLIFV